MDVGLYTSGGTLVLTTTTNASGLYTFTVMPGDYYLQFAKPAGYTFTTQTTGTNTGSDPSTVTGKTGTITLTSGQTDKTWDAGLYQMAVLGNFVWDDLNANGTQDALEPGISGVDVGLYTSGGTLVLTTTTNASGLYTFTVVPGSYYLQFAQPAGYNFTIQTAGTATGSDPSVVTGKTGTFTLTSGQTDRTWDAGLYQMATLGDYVWLDDNGDGLQGGLEPDLASVSVGLYTSGGTLVLTTTTNASGLYTFTVTPGDYYLQFAKPAGYTFTTQTTGTATGSDPAAATGRTGTITLTSGQTDKTWDAGLYQMAVLGNFVWDDLNANGIQDALEPGLNGVDVGLYTSGGTLVLTTTTNASGLYTFTVMPGDYYLQFAKPAGYTFTTQTTGTATGSDPAAATGRTGTVTLTSGQTDKDWDAGLYQMAALGNFVWDDLNANGIQDALEPGISGVDVGLYTSGGTLVLTTTTNASGLYTFTVMPGDYYLQFAKPAGYTFTTQTTGTATGSDPAAATGRTGTITLTSGQTDKTWDAGLYQMAVLGNFVWDDLNANGIQDALEPGISGVDVGLYTSGGTLVLTTTTNASGLYTFTVMPGDYYLQFAKPAGYTFTTQTAGTADGSDPAAATGRTGTITLASGQTDRTWDAGLYQLAVLGNFVWDDLNANGIQDALEPGLNGVDVGLYTSGGTLVLTTTTNASGLYTFTVTPGDYYLQFAKPAGYTFTTQTAGTATGSDPAAAATGRTGTITLTSGQTDTAWDAGVFAGAALGNFVWDDLNANGTQDALEPGISGSGCRSLHFGRNACADHDDQCQRAVHLHGHAGRLLSPVCQTGGLHLYDPDGWHSHRE